MSVPKCVCDAALACFPLSLCLVTYLLSPVLFRVIYIFFLLALTNFMHVCKLPCHPILHLEHVAPIDADDCIAIQCTPKQSRTIYPKGSCRQTPGYHVHADVIMWSETSIIKRHGKEKYEVEIRLGARQTIFFFFLSGVQDTI